MAHKGLYKYTQQEATNLLLGQMGSMFFDNTDAKTPPAGHQFIAITVIQDCTFTTLTGTELASFISTAETDHNSSPQGEQIVNTVVFPAGITLYGRWNAITLNSGVVVAYLGA